MKILAHLALLLAVIFRESDSLIMRYSPELDSLNGDVCDLLT